MKSFFNMVSLLVLLILSTNIIFVYFFWGLFIASESSIKYVFIFFITIFQAYFIMWLIKYFYERPIVNLEYNIKKFLIGGMKDKEINIPETHNAHINYIILFFNKTLNTLKNIKSEFIHGKEIKWEVALAKEIQEKLLTKKSLDVPSLKVIAKSKPAAEIGWDSYDIIQQDDNYYIYVWDATGHWVGAGFIMMMTNALVSWFAKVSKRWNQILALTNDIIKPRVKSSLLMTMLLVRWNETEKKIYMTWAGHEYLMIYKHDEKKCFKIKSWWVALGMTKNIHKLLKERELDFTPKDIIVLYSDGITEAINLPEKTQDAMMFGEQRLMEAIEKSPSMKSKDYKTAASVFKNITIELSKFMGYKHFQWDDVTLAVIQYKSDDYDESMDYDVKVWEEFITEWNW